MNIRRYLPALASLQHSYPSLAYRLRVYFDLPPGPLIHSIPAAGLAQADVVLALLRINSSGARQYVEHLIGRPITIGPACLLVYNYNRAKPLLHSQPVVTWVMKNPPLRNSTRIAHSFPEFCVGRTRQQLIMRGVSRGDIRRAVRRGWIRMEGGAV